MGLEGAYVPLIVGAATAAAGTGAAAYGQRQALRAQEQSTKRAQDQRNMADTLKLMQDDMVKRGLISAQDPQLMLEEANTIRERDGSELGEVASAIAQAFRPSAVGGETPSTYSGAITEATDSAENRGLKLADYLATVGAFPEAMAKHQGTAATNAAIQFQGMDDFWNRAGQGMDFDAMQSLRKAGRKGSDWRQLGQILSILGQGGMSAGMAGMAGAPTSMWSNETQNQVLNKSASSQAKAQSFKDLQGTN